MEPDREQLETRAYVDRNIAISTGQTQIIQCPPLPCDDHPAYEALWPVSVVSGLFSSLLVAEDRLVGGIRAATNMCRR